MKKIYFVIYDKVSKTYNDLFTVPNFESLRRDMEQLIKEDKLQFWPDKVVKQLFSFDVQTGEIVEDVKEWALSDLFGHILEEKKAEAEKIKNEGKKEYAKHAGN